MELYTTPFVEYLSGEWKVDANGKGMVYLEDLNSNAEDHLVASPTQWYWVRKSAQAILYQVANSAGQFNGYSELIINGGNLSATQGVAINDSLSIASNLSEGSSVKYTATNLPSGLTLNAATGALSGKVTQSGTFDFVVNYSIDGWIEKTANYTLTVAPAFTFKTGSDDLTNINSGSEIFAEITSDVYTLNNYNTIRYYIKNGSLPEGVTLTENGEISGTPTVAGSYHVVVGVEAIKITSSKKGETKTVTNDEFTVDLVVTGEKTPEVDPIEEIQTKLDKLTKDLANASTKEEQTSITNQINELKNQIASLNTNTNSGSNNTAPVVLGIIAIVLGVLACGSTMVVVLKKRY